MKSIITISKEINSKLMSRVAVEDNHKVQISWRLVVCRWNRKGSRVSAKFLFLRIKVLRHKLWSFKFNIWVGNCYKFSIWLFLLQPSSCLSDKEEDEIYGFGYGVFGKQMMHRQQQQKLFIQGAASSLPTSQQPLMLQQHHNYQT